MSYGEKSNMSYWSHIKRGKNEVEAVPGDTNRIFKTSERYQATYSKNTVNANQNKYQKQTNKNVKSKRNTCRHVRMK